MRTRPPHHRPARAFTLLEVVLSMAMAAMLVLTLYAGMSIATRAQRTTANATTAIRAATVAAELISRDLESVVVPGEHLAGPFIGTPQLIGTGQADALELYCLGGRAPAGGVVPEVAASREGIRRVELLLRTDVTPAALVRRVTWNLLAAMETEPEEQVICRNVRSFAVRYYDGTGWTTDWDSTIDDTLPTAVELTVVVDDPTRTTSEGAVCRVTRLVPVVVAKPETATAAGTGAGTGGPTTP